MSPQTAHSAVPAEFLRVLHQSISRLQRPARGIPLARLMELAGHAEGYAGVTIDFAAARVLGYPVVVLALPPVKSAGELYLPLSRRERQVAGLVALGLTNKQIAAKLRISILTVKDHVHNILSKTGLANRTALAAAHK